MAEEQLRAVERKILTDLAKGQRVIERRRKDYFACIPGTGAPIQRIKKATILKLKHRGLIDDGFHITQKGREHASKN